LQERTKFERGNSILDHIQYRSTGS